MTNTLLKCLLEDFVLTSLAMAMPWLWSPWHEALLAWLRLAEGVLVPVILCLVDQPLRAALKRTFQRRSGALSPLVGDDCPFQMYFDKDHFRKRGTFGSVTPIGIITNYRRTPGKKRRNRKSKYKLPGLHSGDSVIEKSCLAGSFLRTEPLSKLSCADLTSLEVWQEEEEDNFYATLSDDFSNFSANSTDDNALNEEAKICEDLYGGSFTTIANDDFEFHDTRPCGGEVRMKPTMVVTVQPVNSFRSSSKSGVYIKDKIKTEELLADPTPEQLTDLMNITLQSEDDKKDPDLFQTHEDALDPEPDVIKTDEENSQSPTSLSKATSFSLNDLDLIEKCDGFEKEKVFALPFKSESTMSLYRMRLDKNLESFLSVTKSEGNINGDSGFCSGTQTMNPIWPGYPIRNVSDPLSNHRKPVTSPACVSGKNYPSILHPRMQRIPWISAWRKLGGNRESSESKKNRKDKDSDASKCNDPALRMLLLNDNFELRQRDTFQWKDSIIYARDDSRRRRQTVPQKSHTADFNENTEEYSHYKERHLKNDSFINDVIKQSRNGTSNKKVPRNSSRKGSFKELPRKPTEESPYGRINDFKSGSRTIGNFKEISQPPREEENIYEEITTTKSQIPVDHDSKVKSYSSVTDKSYAQTDILKLINVKDSPRTLDENNGFPAKSNDFKLNININPTLSLLEPSRFNGFEDFSMPPDLSSCNISDLIVNCTPFENREEEMVSEEQHEIPECRKEGNCEVDECNYNSRLQVAYNVNASALEFIDNCEETSYLRAPYEESNMLVDEPDLNANSAQTYFGDSQRKYHDFGFYNPNEGRKEVHKPRCRETNLRQNRLAEDFASNMAEDRSFNRNDKLPAVRREKVNRDKSREVKRRESACRKKRESNIPRRESDYRNKKPRCTTVGQEDLPQKRNEVPFLQKNDSYNGSRWTKERNKTADNSSAVRDDGYARTCVQVEESLLDKCGFGEFERVKKEHHGNHDVEFTQSNGVIRLHCNYQDPDRNKGENANRITIHSDKGVELSRSRNNDVNRIHVKNRNSNFPDRTGNRTDYVELCHKDSVRERKSDVRVERQRRHDTDRKDNDNRVRRKGSSSNNRDRRDQIVERKDSLKDGIPGKRRIGKPDAVMKTGNHLRKTNSFQAARETNANIAPTINDVNRNESVKLNAEISLADEHTRMDNLVYGRRENVNLIQQAEVLQFETFIKPPSYNNLMRNHVGDRSHADYKDRCKQKKIAITDYL